MLYSTFKPCIDDFIICLDDFCLCVANVIGTQRRKDAEEQIREKAMHTEPLALSVYFVFSKK